MPPATAPARRPLRRADVLRAAIELADTEGLDAVSMRRLSQALGVVPMALYKHVADKADLLDGMVDTLIEDMPAATEPGAGQWRTAVRATLLGARAVITAHPWARRAIETRTVRTPAVLKHMERVTQIFLRAGFTPDLTHHLMHLLGNRIWGFSPELFNETDPGPPSPRSRTSGTPDPGDYPGIVTITIDAQARRSGASGCDEDFEFDFALTAILDAAARLRRTRWASTATAP